MSKGGYHKLLTQLQAANALIADLRKRLAQTETHSGHRPIDTSAVGLSPKFKWQDALTVGGAAIGLAALNELRLILFGLCAILMSASFLGHRDWHQKWRSLLTIGICSPMATTGYFTWNNWEENTAKGKVAVYFSESRRFPAEVIDASHSLAPLEANIEKTFAKAPVHQLRLHPGTGKIVMSVIVRNTGNTPIKNARITIISTTPIAGKTMGGYTVDDKNISYEDRVLEPYSRLGEEYFISVEFEDETIPHAIVEITIDADNMDPYLGGGVFSMLRQP